MIVFLTYSTVIVCGYFAARAVAGPNSDKALLIALAPGVGFSILSAVMFASLLLFGQLYSELVAITVLAIGCVCGILTSSSSLAGLRQAPLLRSRSDTANAPDRRGVFFLVLLAVTFLAVARAMHSPHGTGLDAWAIWKLKARFLYEAENWRAMFAPEIHFSHPDYPLLYPLSIAAGWIAAGKETLAAPVFLGVLFTTATAGLAFAAFADRFRAMSAAVLMIATPHFISVGVSQYADIFVAYFALGGVVLLLEGIEGSKKRIIALAGFFLGSGAFVKNEGLVICGAFLAVAAIWSIVKKEKKVFASLLLGAAPMLALVVSFKLIAKTDSHYLNDFHFDPARLVLVGEYLIREVFHENKWVYAWFFVAAAWITGFSERKTVAGTLAGGWVLWMAGIAGVYSVIPPGMDLRDLLATSLDRVLAQGFPVLIYVTFAASPGYPYIGNGGKIPLGVSKGAQ